MFFQVVNEASRQRGVIAAARWFLVHVVLLATAAAAGPEAVVIAVDEGHGNYHTVGGRYAPFAALLRDDGREVIPHRDSVTTASLAGVDILVIANALAAENHDRWALPTPSAFTPAEVDAIHGWVADGGALLLIADHMPFAGAAAALADRFAVEMINGFVLGPEGEGVLQFTVGGGGLAKHPIVDGGVGEHPVADVATFTGHAFTLRPGVDGAPLLVCCRRAPCRCSPRKRGCSRMPRPHARRAACSRGRPCGSGEGGWRSSPRRPCSPPSPWAGGRRWGSTTRMPPGIDASCATWCGGWPGNCRRARRRVDDPIGS